jgi:hypothetical protein
MSVLTISLFSFLVFQPCEIQLAEIEKAREHFQSAPQRLGKIIQSENFSKAAQRLETREFLDAMKTGFESDIGQVFNVKSSMKIDGTFIKKGDTLVISIIDVRYLHPEGERYLEWNESPGITGLGHTKSFLNLIVAMILRSSQLVQKDQDIKHIQFDAMAIRNKGLLSVLSKLGFKPHENYFRLIIDI